MSAHLDEAEEAARCGGPHAYTPDEIRAMAPAPGMTPRAAEIRASRLREQKLAEAYRLVLADLNRVICRAPDRESRDRLLAFEKFCQHRERLMA